MARLQQAWLPLVACIGLLAPAAGQAAPQDDAIAAAERAAEEAEHAASAARQAMVSAETAARAARMAANAARAAMAGQGATVSAPPAPERGRTVVVNENLDVGGGGDRADRSGKAPQDRMAIEREALTAHLSETVLNGTNDQTVKVNSAPDFQILAAEKDKEASVAFTVDLSGPYSGDYISVEKLTLTGSTKLDDSGKKADFGGLKKFANGTTIGFTYTNFITRTEWGQPTADIEGRAIKNCMARATTEEQKKKCDPDPNIAPDAKDKDEYYQRGWSQFIADYGDDGDLDLLLNRVSPGGVGYWGWDFKGNQSGFKFIDRAAFAEKKESHFGFSGTLFGGALLSNQRTSFTGSVTYKRDWEAKDAVNLCQAAPSSTLTQCLTSQDGPPDRKNQAIIAVEGRHEWPVPIGKFPTLAISAEVAADVKNDAWSVTVPLYFAGDKDGALRAGLRGVYANVKDEKNGGRDDDFQLGLFFGVPFSVFPH